ncbi:hypothetical protein MD484_g5480, partial [Candolleomyces efflorescens]
MVDPIGSSIYRKILEHTTDDQRNLICESAAQDLATISLDMHGSRTVQTMIDLFSTRKQINSIVIALSPHVVALMKDLHGNHVIQKCMKKLAPEDHQFIYNVLGSNCVEVATDRYGCCVLQRCIDNATESQRVQLVDTIAFNALTLVQDAYGNYAVQYVLDLDGNRFSRGVIRRFLGHVCALAVQKYSSNVMEKCIRVAEHDTRRIMIDELVNCSDLGRLLRDPYGNYCVQTALDYADPVQRALLVEAIQPFLTLIRNTPYGKRIQNKLRIVVDAQAERRHVAHTPDNGMYGPPAVLYSMSAAPPVYGQSTMTTQLHGQYIGGGTLQTSAGDSVLLNSTHPIDSPLLGINAVPVAAFNGAVNHPYQSFNTPYGM